MKKKFIDLFMGTSSIIIKNKNKIKISSQLTRLEKLLKELAQKEQELFHDAR